MFNAKINARDFAHSLFLVFFSSLLTLKVNLVVQLYEGHCITFILMQQRDIYF